MGRTSICFRAASEFEAVMNTVWEIGTLSPPPMQWEARGKSRALSRIPPAHVRRMDDHGKHHAITNFIPLVHKGKPMPFTCQKP